MSRRENKLRAISLQDQCHAELVERALAMHGAIGHVLKGDEAGRVARMRAASDVELLIISVLATTALADALLRRGVEDERTENEHGD